MTSLDILTRIQLKVRRRILFTTKSKIMCAVVQIFVLIEHVVELFALIAAVLVFRHTE